MQKLSLVTAQAILSKKENVLLSFDLPVGAGMSFIDYGQSYTKIAL